MLRTARNSLFAAGHRTTGFGTNAYWTRVLQINRKMITDCFASPVSPTPISDCNNVGEADGAAIVSRTLALRGASLPWRLKPSTLYNLPS